MGNNPLVSVLMTAYNREQYIAEAIESVLESTYTNFELIIVDDCSKDTSLSIANDFSKSDKRVKVFKNEYNLGDYANRNRAASYANGFYLMHCDSDDKIFKDGIQKCVEAMLQFPEAPFGMYLYFREKDAQPFFMTSKEAIKQHFFQQPFLSIGPGGTIVTKSFFEKINGYPEKYGPSGDMYFNLKCAVHAPIVMLPFDFLFYRRHDQQEINNSYSYLVNNYAYLRDALNDLPIPLQSDQIKWIGKKNKRRFIVNIFNFLKSTRSIVRTRKVMKEANFTFPDLLQGIFH